MKEEYREEKKNSDENRKSEKGQKVSENNKIKEIFMFVISDRRVYVFLIWLIFVFVVTYPQF